MEQLLEQVAEAPEWMKFIIIAASTLVSEDLTTISAGVLASQGSIHIVTALTACFVGIFVGDGLLYVVGLLVGRPALKLPIMRNMLTEEKVTACAEWFQKNGMAVVIISRFIPGARLPTYFAAGLMGAGARYFLPAAAVAVAIWTPLLIGGSWFFGEQFQNYVTLDTPLSWLGLAGGVVLLFAFSRLLMRFGDWKKRKLLRSRIHRILTWEFWPILVVYFPVALYNIWLALKYRRLFLPLISNPGIQYSGYIGESKNEIMSAFTGQEDFLARFLYLPQDTVEARLKKFQDWMEQHQVSFPLILKPDVGQRGAGVQTVRDMAAARAYLEAVSSPVNAQEFAPGPYEFGVFYQRFPKEETGRVSGLTGKDFPLVVGDGTSTLEELILNLPSGMGRYHIFLNQFKDRLQQVFEKGETQVLARAGNHCLGTIFLDSSHLITPAMSEKFDEISKSIPGFFIGRYDIRTRDLEAFRQGKDFKIIELNGASGEPSQIYDARRGLVFAYRTLFKQYRDLWETGAQNAALGVPVAPLKTLFDAFRMYRQKRVSSTSK